MSGGPGGHGSGQLAQVAVRYLAGALVVCVGVKVLATAVTPLLPVLETGLLIALVCAWVVSRLHL